MKKAVAYYRVSTKYQGLSGLGLEAQKKAIADFVYVNGYEILRDFSEVESGRKNQRPKLKQAFQVCQKEKATLLIATIDRLSRNLAFISALTEAKARFIIVDMPAATKFQIHIMGAVAQLIAEQTAANTKAALQSAKNRGVVLGKNGRDVLSKLNKEKADMFARHMLPIIQQCQLKGYRSMQKISKELNRRRIKPYCGSGHRWHPTTVYNLICRIKNLGEVNNHQ